jgi:Protein of unknown function (DUF1214)
LARHPTSRHRENDPLRLSKFEGKPAPPKAPATNWIAPLTPQEERTSPKFFDILAFTLQFCPPAPEDAGGKPLTGSKRYTITFAKGDLPPVNAFWHRYLINSPMLPSLKRNAGGRITLYVQHAEPPAAQRSNWLPAPAGPFFMVLRLYWPKESALGGRWKQPPVRLQP